MINPQQPRERIKRPEMPQYEPEPEDDNSEGLSQDDLNEWLTQKVIRLELDTFRKEAKEGRSPLQQRPQRVEPQRFKEKPKQPYESMYGKTEDEVTPVKKKDTSKNKKMITLVLIIVIAGYLAWTAYQYFVLGYTLGG